MSADDPGFPVLVVGVCALALALAFGGGFYVGHESEGPLVEVKPLVKCDLQQLWRDAEAACEAKGGRLSYLGDVLDGTGAPIDCVREGDRHVVALKELGQ